MTSTPHRQSRRGHLLTRLAAASLAAVVVLAIVETISVCMVCRTHATRRAWTQVESLVRQNFHAGDLLVFVPNWIDPIGRLHVGDLLNTKQVSRPDSDNYSRIWVIGLAGFRSKATTDASLLWRKSVGKLAISLYRRQPVQITFDFYERVSEAHVRMTDRRGRETELCHWDTSRKRHQCQSRWNNVRQKLAEIGYHLRRCIYAHPVDGKVLELRYSMALLGDVLVFFTGLDNYDARYRARRAWYMAYRYGKPGPSRLDPVSVDILLDGHRLGVVRQPIDEQWHRNILDTSRFAGKLMNVTLRVHSNHVYGKALCFYAQARRDEKGLTRTVMKYP